MDYKGAAGVGAEDYVESGEEGELGRREGACGAAGWVDGWRR